MARPPITSQAAFIEAALEFIDRHGSDDLSLRALGKEMNVSHATIYRHFSNKDELLNALIDNQLGESIRDAELGTDPKQRMFSLAMQLRAHFDAHPNLLRPMINGTGQGQNAFNIARLTIEALRELGFSGKRLTQWLRVLENFVIGSLVYDYAAAPDHLVIRASRINTLASAGHLDAEVTEAEIAEENQSAFEKTLRMLLDSAEAEGKIASK